MTCRLIVEIVLIKICLKIKIILSHFMIMILDVKFHNIKYYIFLSHFPVKNAIFVNFCIAFLFFSISFHKRHIFKMLCDHFFVCLFYHISTTTTKKQRHCITLCPEKPPMIKEL